MLGYLKRYSFGPRRCFSVPRIICHSNVETLLLTAVCDELILARSLEAEELSVKRLVVWVAKYCANSVLCE